MLRLLQLKFNGCNMFNKLTTIILISMIIAGCTSNQAKIQQRQASFSEAKNMLVSFDMPHEYIKEGKLPNEVQFEKPATSDAISRHAGLATALSTLSITSTFMVTMGTSDIDARTSWKQTFQRPILFARAINGDDLSFKNVSNLLNPMMLDKGYSIKKARFVDSQIGWVKDNTELSISLSKEYDVMVGTQEQKQKTMWIALSIDGNKQHVSTEFYQEVFAQLVNKGLNFYLYLPSNSAEPAHILAEQGRKLYFVQP